MKYHVVYWRWIGWHRWDSRKWKNDNRLLIKSNEDDAGDVEEGQHAELGSPFEGFW